jgi:hypothetical protein
MKIRFVFIVVIIISLYFIWLISGKLKLEHQPVIFVNKIHSEYLNEDLFIKKISWGLTYDHSVIILSSFPKNTIEPDSTSEYVFLSSEIFYRLTNDSLLIFTSLKSKKPLNFNSNIKIIQYELKNVEIMNLRGNNNYKKRGLKMVY